MGILDIPWYERPGFKLSKGYEDRLTNSFFEPEEMFI
tara:strand:- start:10324 stop:10434 length:111 start_codon:yes stop_codon:yes gene_type:complete